MTTMTTTTELDRSDLSASLQYMRDSAYRWGQCQAILYDQAREELFPRPFLSTLYSRCAASGRAKFGIIEPLFCGQRNLSHDTIVAYLSTVPLVVLGEWRERYNGSYELGSGGEIPASGEPYFHSLGFCFPALMPNLAAAEHQPNASPNSLFGAYAFFQEAWRSPQQIVLTYLGLSFLFCEFRAAAIHGVRYQSNHLTARWMRNFGFRDLSPALPSYLYRASTGQLEPGVISYCLRSDFADLLRNVLLQSQRDDSARANSNRDNL